MVLFKRKPVTYPEPPELPENLNIKTWYIPHTKEWFLDYDDYLKRMDYYNTKKFVCEITGNSCLTYLEAYESEKREMETVERNFPEHLKEPILRHIQFSTVPRIDQLVDLVYTTFKNDYYPGETVMIRLNDYKNDFKTKCIIREKAKFNAVVDANNVHRPTYCQYRVSRVDNGLELVVDESQITRDRNNFTKWFVKTFIKLSVTRSPKLGAPWIVKNKYAERYRIPIELPPELAHFKEKPKPQKKLMSIRPKGDEKTKSRAKSGEKNIRNQGQTKSIKQILPKGAKIEILSAPQPPKRTIGEDLKQPFDLKNRKPIPHKIDDLGRYTQEVLEVWTFLNIYRVPLILDTFTFDDFLTALRWDSAKRRCPLLDEIVCAILSAFLTEKDTVEIQIPEQFQEEIEEIGPSKDEDEPISNGSLAVKQDDANGDSTVKDEDAERKEVDKNYYNEESEKVNEEDDNEEEEEVFEQETNRIDDYLTYRNTSWTERLEKRLFKDGGWQIILMGVLDEVRDLKEYEKYIIEIFQTLAPLDASVSPGNIQNRFFNDLPITLRIKALSILCSLLVNSPIIRAHLDKCMEEATGLRRERFEKAREYKAAFLKAQNIDKECRELLGSGNAPSTANSVTTAASTTDSNAEPNDSKKRRRRAGLTADPTEEELNIAKTNLEYGTKLAARTAQLKIAEELRIQRRTLEKKINECDVQRVKFVGRDRLFNRYWWFENNGLPNLGGKGSHDDEDEEVEEEDEEEEDDDEFLEETYLMGRLWVQGPSKEDLAHGLKIRQAIAEQWNEVNKESQKEDEDEDGDEDEENDKAETNGDNNDEKESEVSPKKERDVEEEPSIEVQKAKESTNELPESFVEHAEKVFKIKFVGQGNLIKSATDDRILVDQHGATTEDLSAEQRKVIEENPDPLLTSDQWRYYDKPSEIEDLIKWLNPWGEREVKLQKELNIIKDQIKSSISSRRKALKLDNNSAEELELLKIIDETVISESEPESESDVDSDIHSEEFSSASENEDKSMDEIPRTRRSIAKAEEENEERIRRENAKREKEAERQAKKDRSKPSARIAKRELKKRKLREHEEKRRLVEDSKEKLEQLREDNEIQRCLDWVNQSALETLGHSHYEGPKKSKAEKLTRKSRR